MRQEGDDPGRRVAAVGAEVAEVAGLAREELVLGDAGRALLLVPEGDDPDRRERRLRAALARLRDGAARD